MASKSRSYRITRKGMIATAIGAVVLTSVGFGTGYILSSNISDKKVVTKIKKEKEYITVIDMSGMDTYYDVPLSHDLQDYICKICEDKGVSMSLIIAMIDQESGFNQENISGTDDYGLMQINTVNFQLAADKYHCTNIINPYQNVYVGISMISELLIEYEGDEAKSLMAYNLGQSGAEEAFMNGITSSDYSSSIIAKKEMYERSISNE